MEYNVDSSGGFGPAKLQIQMEFRLDFWKPAYKSWNNPLQRIFNLSVGQRMVPLM